MVRIPPLWLHRTKATTTTTTYSRSNEPTRIIKIVKNTNDYGYIFPKGLYLHHTRRGILISKDGVAYHIKNGNHCMARFCALLDIPLFILSIPFMLWLYMLFIILCQIIFIFLLLFGWCIAWDFTITFLNIKINSNKLFIQAMVYIFIRSIVSILYILCYTILTPLRILLPEFTTWIGEHKWGQSTEFEHFKYLQ